MAYMVRLEANRHFDLGLSRVSVVSKSEGETVTHDGKTWASYEFGVAMNELSGKVVKIQVIYSYDEDRFLVGDVSYDGIPREHYSEILSLLESQSPFKNDD